MVRSIPPHMRNKQRVHADSTMRRTIGKHRSYANQVKPTIVKNGSTPARRTVATPLILPSWPDDRADLIIEYENRVWVIVEFPRHTLEQIKWSNDDDLLTIESSFASCSYINKIALPQDRGKRINVTLNNGLFVATFERQYPL